MIATNCLHCGESVCSQVQQIFQLLVHTKYTSIYVTQYIMYLLPNQGPNGHKHVTDIIVDTNKDNSE